MKVNKDIINNNVKAENQTSQKFKVTLVPNAVKRVLFVGNSITLHETAPHIGWNNNWGMAASAEQNDYVHIVVQSLTDKYGNVSYCVCNASEWERNFWDENVLHKFEGARNFDADVVIVRLGENVNRDELANYDFAECCNKFIKFVAPNAKQVIVTDTFWEYEPICTPMCELATENGYKFVSICDLGYLDENKAVGKFWHEGVASHPGDLGMQRIAERLLKVL